MHLLKQLMTMECPPGIYESEYHAMAIIWNMRNIMTSPELFGPKAAHKVSAMKIKYSAVHRILSFAHMDLHCLTGPHRNMVLNTDKIAPIV
jgi:hypothetical protein